MHRVLRVTLVSVSCTAAAAAVMLAAFATGEAYPHDAPQGWSYPTSCCSGYDCRKVAAGELPGATGITVRPVGGGYVISSTGEVVAAGDTRLRHSPDGDYHWCSAAGADDGRTICLFVPPRGM